MLIERLQVKGLLSFGPDGIDLPLEPLNVIIGPNGSGKSNLLKVLGLLKAAPDNLSQGAMETGYVGDWFWQPHRDDHKAMIDVITAPRGSLTGTIRHLLAISPTDGHFKVNREEVSPEGKSSSSWAVQQDSSGSIFLDYANAPTSGLELSSGQSLLSVRDWSKLVDPSYPAQSIRGWDLFLLSSNYRNIRLHRNWIYGDLAPSRREQSADLSGYRLAEYSDNLASVLSNLSGSSRDDLTKYLRRFYEGIVGVSASASDGKVSLLIEESGGRLIPAARLSDGTLRYLSLLAILLDPDPPPLIGIEEPELGLHPDVIYDLAELLVEAATRTQLVVTTHSPTLIDALTDYPSSVVACEKYEGQTRFRRVSPESLASWIGDQGLGEAWAGGGIGGNRW